MKNPIPVLSFSSKEELEILKIIQDNIPDGPLPFKTIAEMVGTSEARVIELILKLKREGYIRRFGATLKHQVAGYDWNVMVAWRVEPEEKIREIEKQIVSVPEITHCYIRKTHPEWPYNLYTMIHGRSEKECREIIKRIEEETGIREYQLLFSDEELKKTSMQYF